MKRCKTCKFFVKDGIHKGMCNNERAPVKETRDNFGCVLHEKK